jgi:hypothetical protein
MARQPHVEERTMPSNYRSQTYPRRAFLRDTLAGLVVASGLPVAAAAPSDLARAGWARLLRFEFNTQQAFDTWQTGFSDYSDDQDRALFEFEVTHADLPAEVHLRRKALRIKGHNRSDDMFMFLTRPIDGLQPSTRYQLVFDVELASNAPLTSVGIGGSPGGSVFLKAGAVPFPPEVIKDASGYFHMNLDKGNQAVDGRDMIGIGNIGTTREDEVYQLIHRGSAGTRFSAQTDSRGRLWVIVGTDSGYEGLTVLYYVAVNVFLYR